MMNKLLIFILAFVLAILLFAAPSWAAVTITATQVGGSDQVAISYVTDGNLPRAFGLDITVTDGTITACEPNMVGECTATVRGYGIFMGTIVIEADGIIYDYGTPVAPSDATGALGGLGTAGITIEMFSLYQEPNAPPLAGELCRITVSEPCTMNIAGNSVRCGTEGVVMEDPEEVPVVTYVPTDVVHYCLEVGSTIGDIYITQAIQDLWVSIGMPAIWLCESNSKGDVDLDGFVTPNDVIPIVNNLDEATDATNYLADLDRDGFITPNDVVSIINHLDENVGPCG